MSKWSDEYEDQMNYKPRRYKEDGSKTEDQDVEVYDWIAIALGAAVLGLLGIAIGFGSHEMTKPQQPPSTEQQIQDKSRPYYDAPGNANETFRENFGR